MSGRPYPATVTVTLNDRSFHGCGESLATPSSSSMLRRGGREKRVVGRIRQLPFARLANPYAPIEILSADHVEAIINGAFTILETRGMRFLEPGSRKLLQAAGAEPVDDLGTMRLDRGLVREKLALVPAQFALRARNRDHDIRIGGRPRLHLGRRTRVRQRPRQGAAAQYARGGLDFLKICRASTSSTRNPAARSRPWTCRPRPGISTFTSRR